MRNPREPQPIITIEARANQEKLLTKPNLEAVEKRSRGHEKSRFNSRGSVELLYAHDVDRCALPAPLDR